MVALLHTSGGDAGTIIGNRYRLEHRLAVTARTEVWSGHDHVLERAVTVKLIHAGDVPTGAARLTVGGAVAVYDVISHAGVAVVISERVDAWPLDRVLEQRITLRSDDVITIVDGVAHVLADAHALGVAHGAVTPSNILVQDDGTVRLTDFRGRGDGAGAGQFDPLTDLRALERLLADLITRCDPATVPSHIRWLAGRPMDTGVDGSGIGVFEFRLALRPPARPTESPMSHRVRRWLIPVATIVATITVVAAASSLLDRFDRPQPAPSVVGVGSEI